MTAHGPDHPIGIMMDGTDGEAERARRLDELRHRTRQLERQRIAVGSSLDRARLVALDVELCRVEATRRMLAPLPIPGAPSREPMRPHAEPLET